MHISEGFLSMPVLLSGGVLTAAGTAVGLKKLDYDRVPEVAILSATFFVGSFIHAQVGPSSVHLLLGGVIGLLLGWAAFPAILIALFLQGILFSFGGLTTLGVNTFNVAAPSLFVYYMFGKTVRTGTPRAAMIAGFFAGALAVVLTVLCVAIALIGTEEGFIKSAEAVAIVHIPVMIIEGIVTAIVVRFIRKVKPEILEAPYV